MRRRPLTVLAALLLGATAACGGTDRPVAGPTTVPSSAEPSAGPSATPPAPRSSPPASASPAWRVGASALPLRPDGFGQVLDTPVVLRRRTLQAPDLLPPPPGGHWAARVLPVDAGVRARMGSTWSPACPVALADLRLLRVAFRGFDGRAHTGELVVAARVAGDVVGVFHRLWSAGFPIEELRLPTTADVDAAPTGDGNLTAGYACRAARGQRRFSSHAYGIAVDLDPFQNPEVKRDLVLPELASAYVDRRDVRPGMVVAGGPAVAAFRAIGWTWGGTWTSSKDWMHFSADGR
ncbi:MAG: hypothetical protein JWN17_2413 [Frankiales bacterium]|nr:hypothetical protein [Frankiales bacterium]